MYGLGNWVVRTTKTGLVKCNTHTPTQARTDKPHQHRFQEASFAWAPISVWDLRNMPSTVAATS